MRRDATGRYEITSTAGEAVRAFVPAPLPPKPPVVLEGPLQTLHEQALLACGRLDGVSSLLPDPEVFLYAYVRREALLSSQIEGTQSSLSDLLLFELEEAPGVPFDDVVEVSSYVAGLEHGLTRHAKGFPLSSRLLREIHARLLARGRCADRLPGEFRRSQNWIGGTRPGNASFVPPPPGLVEDCMAALEQFIHGGPEGEHALPVLVRAALAHVQFETIHPFLDGNGRLGRLLIVLILMGLGRSGVSVQLCYRTLRRRPLTSINQLRELSGLSFPTASKAIETLVGLGIAREITGGRRNRLFAYDAYLAILSEGTEPL